MLFLETPVKFLKYIGSARISDLKSKNIQTIEDLLLYLPIRYEDRRNPIPFSEIKPEQTQLISGKIINVNLRWARSRMSILEAIIENNKQYIKAVWFNQPFLKQVFKPDDLIWLYGKAEFDKHGINFQFKSPEFEIISKGDLPAVHSNKIIPVYRRINKTSSKMLRRIIYNTLFETEIGIEEVLPPSLVRKGELITRIEAFKKVHFPDSMEKLEEARSPAHARLIYEEFALLQSALYLSRKKKRTEQGIRIKIDPDLKDKLSSKIPFKLTTAQKKSLEEIYSDLEADYPMNRLIQGDVGSGKTVVALLSAAVTVQSGYSAALMAPTEILAEQHFRTTSELLQEDNYKIVLLTSSTVKQNPEIHDEIKAGKYNIIIGTHALIQKKVKIPNLGLVIIDEQHRFGVEQREVLAEKSLAPNILVMTATPIPRSLALTAFGNLDLSIIDQMPKGRKPVETILSTERKRDDIYKFLLKNIDAGRQVYVIYPLITQTEKSDLKAATEMSEKLQEEFIDYKVGLLHGKLSSEEKEEIMRRFKEGKINILVSTTVVEVGIDVPNATVMLIEHAERFGLSQLHQLRGRIGRGQHKSYCILMINPPGAEDPKEITLTDEARERLKIMRESNDGFVIAGKDLEIRGPGEFLGTRQSGLPKFRAANIIRDYDILLKAYKDCHWFFALPDIEKSPDYNDFTEYLRKWWRQNILTT
ncbi:MAG: ATP-dependent DNA helicase RecG [Acidobacteria bacterium]|nr:ATP-dependent DNA helicase RecG [Acidobacteriota bacterium]